MVGDLAQALHLISVVIWIGGMFFILLGVQPAIARRMHLEARLPLWTRLLHYFFAWSWVSVLLMLLSGSLLVLMRGGMANAPLYVHLMGSAGALMAVLFAWTYLMPFRGLSRAAKRANWPEGARQLGRVRFLLSLKLVIGLLTLLLVGLRVA